MVQSVAETYLLTERERQVLALTASGVATESKEIAVLMNISPHTAKAFLRMVMIKMGVRNRAAIIKKVFFGHLSATAPTGPSFEVIIERAVKVIGNRDEAMRWLGTPVRALDYATPISLLGTSVGATRVDECSDKWSMASGE